MYGKKTGKRLLSWVLVLIMALSMLPLNVLADEVGGTGRYSMTLLPASRGAMNILTDFAAHRCLSLMILERSVAQSTV